MASKLHKWEDFQSIFYLNSEDENFYTGKDKTTKWSKLEYARCFKTEKLLIVKVLYDIKNSVKILEEKIVSFKK